ncbi:cytochrome c oxidase assembly protein [Paenibacillus sp. MBLB4367]|uniref:cytochrome c oxidase assembly protein n=1 Tax=Paenibacillus sp. MBLB4367 TaxID=3384767 RepID=UPI0039082951
MHNHLEMHGASPSFSDLWSPGVLLITLLVGYVYFYFTGPGRHRFAGSEPVAIGKKLLFVTALALFYIAQGTPLSYYGHAHLFSAHMLQQSILYLVMPPLVYMSIPGWMLNPLLDRKWMRKWVYPFTQPLFSVLLFNLLFSMYHIPLIFNAVAQHPVYHLGYHFILIAAAFHMWFPVFNNATSWKRMSDLQTLAYIFANGVLLTPACALIIFAKDLLYEPYIGAPLIIEALPPLDDQQLGGTIMKIIQEIVYGFALAYIFFRWFRMERSKDEPIEPNSQDTMLRTSNGGNLNGA